MEIEGLARFTAYTNKAVKVVFDDRTIVRMIYGCSTIRLLTRLGEELMLNIQQPSSAGQALLHEYRNYITVSEEFFTWAFQTPQERQEKEELEH